MERKRNRRRDDPSLLGRGNEVRREGTYLVGWRWVRMFGVILWWIYVSREILKERRFVAYNVFFFVLSVDLSIDQSEKIIAWKCRSRLLKLFDLPWRFSPYHRSILTSQCTISQWLYFIIIRIINCIAGRCVTAVQLFLMRRLEDPTSPRECGIVSEVIFEKTYVVSKFLLGGNCCWILIKTFLQ